MKINVTFSESNQYIGADFGETNEVKVVLSAYDVAVKNGFKGSEEEWLASLQGEPFTYDDFTEEQLAGLKGEKGDPGYTPQKGVDYFDGQAGQPGKDGSPGKDGRDGYTPIRGTDYWTEADKAEMVETVLENIQQPSYVNTDISVIDTGLTYARGLLTVKVVGSTLWIIDSGVYNFTDSFKTSKNRTVLEFTLPKSISNRLSNTNGAFGTTGTISYYPALAYENVTYTTFNCQSYLKRSKIGEMEDTFQVVYTGLASINGGGMCGFHLRMQLLLV